MNNQQFRRLVLDAPKQQDGSPDKSPAPRPSSSTMLGARKHSSLPMTPRQVGRNSVQADFARQLAERNAKAKPPKMFKSSAPKGTKLAAGYMDRTKERVDDEDNETAQRIKNLEESMKLGQIDRETFERLVQEITDGDISSTHLVKGLDRKLLERVRRGEDVLSGESKKDGEAHDKEPAMEHEFDELAEQEIGPVVREKFEKKGERATVLPSPVAGVKRSRNDILAELKAQRQAAAEAAAVEHEKKYPSLGPGFRKVNTSGETHRIETDARGREVLIITGPDGKEKRKVRKQRVEEPAPEVRHDLDDVNKPLNMHNLPEPKKEEESEDEDIFEGVGSNYNPLADVEDGDESEEEQEEEDDTKASGPTNPKAESTQALTTRSHLASESGEGSDTDEEIPPASTSFSKMPQTKRDYFANISRTTATETAEPSESSVADATVRAALQKVRNLDANSTLLSNLSEGDPASEASKEARLKKRAAELAAQDRDMEDMDLGFGGSRFDDAEEMEREGEKVKFSEWKGLGAEENDDDGEGGGRGGKRRKRGPKKKKGDKNKAEDVLRVMERQREKKTLG